MAMQALIRSGDTIKVSRSFGIVGSAAIAGSNIPVVVVAANNNEPISPQQVNMNKPLVKMINALASIDGFIKQRLENQKIISDNEKLSQRESQIEQQQAAPQIEVIQPDAERVDGSAAGALAVGGLLLLTLDPVQEAIKDLFDSVTSMGRFVTGAVSAINDVFKFFVGGSASEETAEAPAAEPREGGVTATPAPPPQEGMPPTPTTEASTEQATPTEKPSFFRSVASSALTGAAVGSFVPKVGTAVGGVIGGAYGALSYAFGSSGGSSSSSSSAPASTPAATGGATSAPASTTSSSSTPAAQTQGATEAAAPGEIPKNDIVALGNYLVGMGAQRDKLQHSAFGPVGKHSKNSRHYKDMALDVNFPGPNEAAILDSLEPQLRAAGYNTIWRKPGHYTHMHVSVGGPEGKGGGSYGDNTSLMAGATEAISGIANQSLEQLGKLFGAIGGAVVDPGIPRTDIGATISAAATEMNSEVAASRSEPEPSLPQPPMPPRINRTDAGAIQNPATASDRNSVYYYLRRFGYQDLSTPESTLMPATVAA